jgi:hypothetical protein
LTAQALTSMVVERLKAVGYRPLQTPFSVGTISFDFTAALQGSGGRASDLVLVIDTSITTDPLKIGERTRQRLVALARALDVAGSSLVLTAVLVGAPLPPPVVEAIAKAGRVLIVADDPRDARSEDSDAAAQAFDDRLRVLLPLQLMPNDEATADPFGTVLQSLESDAIRTLAEPLFAQASRGEKAVTRALGNLLEGELTKGLTH